jgi:hypothetical protein
MSGRAAYRQGRRLPWHGLSRWLCLGALALTAPAWAGVWTFASDGPLFLGGALSGGFGGTDLNTDGTIQIGEVSSFVANYEGAPPSTSSFGISGFQSGDLFSFDLGTGILSFQVSDALFGSISGGTDGLTAVVGSDFVDGGGSLVVTSVPEPATLTLVASTLALVGWQRARAGKAAGKAGCTDDRHRARLPL